jgi:hypothetical protein
VCVYKKKQRKKENLQLQFKNPTMSSLQPTEYYRSTVLKLFVCVGKLQKRKLDAVPHLEPSAVYVFKQQTDNIDLRALTVGQVRSLCGQIDLFVALRVSDVNVRTINVVKAYLTNLTDEVRDMALAQAEDDEPVLESPEPRDAGGLGGLMDMVPKSVLEKAALQAETLKLSMGDKKDPPSQKAIADASMSVIRSLDPDTLSQMVASVSQQLPNLMNNPELLKTAFGAMSGR